ncbi:MAG: hypothetical protein WCJ72_19920 [Chryseobacterium sp.]|jgi:hypothetical protein
MAKIIVNYDTKKSKLEFYFNNSEIEDIFSIFIYRDITNSYKYTMEIVSDDGRQTIKNGEIVSHKNSDLFLKKFLNAIEVQNNE